MITKFAVIAAILTGVLVAGLVYQAIGARRRAQQHPPPGALIDVGAERLHVVCAGAGRPTVLFEAGIAASSLSWTRVMPEVATFARTCAYDRPGLGWSERSQSPRTVDRMLEELRGVLTHAAPRGGVVLVGHSFGTFLTLMYAERHPRDVAGLILLDPPVEWQDASPHRIRLLHRGIRASHLGRALARVGVVRGCLALLTGGAPGVPRNLVRGLGPTAKRTLEHLVGEVRKLPPELHPIVQALWCEPRCFRGLAEHLGALEPTATAAARVASLGNVPLTIVSAGDHPPDIVARQRALASLSTRGRHIVASKSSHWIHLDEPELVVDTIRQVADNP
jgi:pimeloyl-ACP methyl ester carboxylesterase